MPIEQSGAARTPSVEEQWGDEERLRHLWQNVLTKARIEKSPFKEDFIDSWYWQMKNALRLSDGFKKWYYASVTATAVATATVPTLIAFTGGADPFISTVLRIAAAILGVLVAGATTLLGVVEVGNRWRLYRAFAQELEAAAWVYLKDNRKNNGNGGTAYDDFVATIDDSRKWFDRAYLNQVAVLGQGRRRDH